MRSSASSLKRMPCRAPRPRIIDEAASSDRQGTESEGKAPMIDCCPSVRSGAHNSGCTAAHRKTPTGEPPSGWGTSPKALRRRPSKMASTSTRATESLGTDREGLFELVEHEEHRRRTALGVPACTTARARGPSGVRAAASISPGGGSGTSATG